MVRFGQPGGPRPSAAEWQRARDLIAAGHGIREAARAIGVPHPTLLRRAKDEGWYRPDKEAASMPPPPPPKKPKADPPGAVLVGCGKAPPDPTEVADDLLYYRALIRWATEGLSVLARHTPNVQMWLVEKLPNVLKALAAIDAGPKQESGNSALLDSIAERLNRLSAPLPDAEAAGVEPPKAQDGEA